MNGAPVFARARVLVKTIVDYLAEAFAGRVPG
ncbi:MAG: hypothetical protein AABN95_09340 [Acidobacteriota bacterium]